MYFMQVFGHLECSGNELWLQLARCWTGYPMTKEGKIYSALAPNNTHESYPQCHDDRVVDVVAVVAWDSFCYDYSIEFLLIPRHFLLLPTLQHHELFMDPIADKLEQK